MTAPVVGDHFGPRGNRFHAGIDLPAPTGTPVYAARSGEVIWAGWKDGGWGFLVIVSHGHAERSMYAHLSRIDVRSGVWIGQGVRVGLVGATGDATGPHLHFEVRVRGAACRSAARAALGEGHQRVIHPRGTRRAASTRGLPQLRATRAREAAVRDDGERPAEPLGSSPPSRTCGSTAAALWARARAPDPERRERTRPHPRRACALQMRIWSNGLDEIVKAAALMHPNRSSPSSPRHVRRRSAALRTGCITACSRKYRYQHGLTYVKRPSQIVRGESARFGRVVPSAPRSEIQ